MRNIALVIVCIVMGIASTQASPEARDMQGNGPEAEFASVFLYHVPNQAFGHALAPTFVGPADAPE